MLAAPPFGFPAADSAYRRPAAAPLGFSAGAGGTKFVPTDLVSIAPIHRVSRLRMCVGRHSTQLRPSDCDGMGEPATVVQQSTGFLPPVGFEGLLLKKKPKRAQ